MTIADKKRILADLEKRLLGGASLTTHDFESPFGGHYQDTKRFIVQHGSDYLKRKYAATFGDFVPAELSEYDPKRK
jgi:hypothetical protein